MSLRPTVAECRHSVITRSQRQFELQLLGGAIGVTADRPVVTWSLLDQVRYRREQTCVKCVLCAKACNRALIRRQAATMP
jgi:ferredoxin